jgi:hypothetical protein
MQSSAEYRARARQCVRKAEHAKNDYRLALLQQAELLFQIASLLKQIDKYSDRIASQPA